MADWHGGSTMRGYPLLGKAGTNNRIPRFSGNLLINSSITDDGTTATLGNANITGQLSWNGTAMAQTRLTSGQLEYWTGSAWQEAGRPFTIARLFATSTADQTTFTISGGYTPGLINVYLNGSRLQDGIDYTASNGTTVVLSQGIPPNQDLEFEKISGSAISLTDASTLGGFSASSFGRVVSTNTWSALQTFNVGIALSNNNAVSILASDGTPRNAVNLSSGNTFTIGDTAVPLILSTSTDPILKIGANDRILFHGANFGGALATTGTLDWNHASNSRAGTGQTLLLGTATNGPGDSAYYHAFNFEYQTRSGSGNITQFAIPYRTGAENKRILFRNSYNSSWSTWTEIMTDSNLFSRTNTWSAINTFTNRTQITLSNDSAHIRLERTGINAGVCYLGSADGQLYHYNSTLTTSSEIIHTNNAAGKVVIVSSPVLDNADVTSLATGKYSVGSAWIGSPFAGFDSRNQGYLEVVRWTLNPTNYIMQIHTQVNIEKIQRYRFRENGVWTTWYDIVSDLNVLNKTAGWAYRLVYQDTRSVNTLPQGYTVGVHQEFKTRTTIGITDALGSGTYCMLETRKGWTDNSGGLVIQIAYVDSGMTYMRIGDNATNTWGTWITGGGGSMERYQPYRSVTNNINTSSSGSNYGTLWYPGVTITGKGYISKMTYHDNYGYYVAARFTVDGVVKCIINTASDRTGIIVSGDAIVSGGNAIFTLNTIGSTILSVADMRSWGDTSLPASSTRTGVLLPQPIYFNSSFVVDFSPVSPTFVNLELMGGLV